MASALVFRLLSLPLDFQLQIFELSTSFGVVLEIQAKASRWRNSFHTGRNTGFILQIYRIRDSHHYAINSLNIAKMMLLMEWFSRV